MFNKSVVFASPLTALGVTDDDEEFVVEAIVSEKDVDRGKHYLVKWLWYLENDNMWEPYEHVAETQALHL